MSENTSMFSFLATSKTWLVTSATEYQKDTDINYSHWQNLISIFFFFFIIIIFGLLYAS